MTSGAERARPPRPLWPALVAGASYAGAMQVLDVLGFAETWSWGQAALQGVLFTTGMAVALAVQYRFSASEREQAEVEAVVTAGVLPEGAGEEWSGRLAAHRRRHRTDLAGVVGLSALGAALVAVVSPLPEGPGAWGGLYAAGLALVGVVLGLRQRRRLATVDRLRAELDERLDPVGSGEPPHGTAPAGLA